jgi:hypothetical protein
MDPARSPSDALTPAVEEKTAQGPLSSPGSFLSSYGVLRGAFLSGADLGGASMHGADLSDASLLLADLSEANLREANLSGADLKEADLRYADFSGATGVTNEQLAQQAATLIGGHHAQRPEVRGLAKKQIGQRGGWEERRHLVAAPRTNFSESRLEEVPSGCGL